MKKQIRFYVGGTSVSVGNIIEVNDDRSEVGIELNVGFRIDNLGGDDGESAIFTPAEFEEFITACKEVLVRQRGQ